MIAFVAGALAFAMVPAFAQEVHTLKLATLAPEGSSWMNMFHEWAANIEKRTQGGVKVKFYAGGVAGDERDAVRKMRLGQLNAAAVTAVGLGLIQPEVRVLELPFLFRNYDELDFVRNTLDGELRKKFEEKNYVLLGWGDVGPVHLFTNRPIRSKEDLQATKLWAWVDDIVVQTLFKDIGLTGVPLGVPDVLPSLSTGIINACYGSPLSTLALQWHSKVHYITSMVISQSIGATVMTKAAWDHLSPEQQSIVRDESNRLTIKLLKKVRDDNESSLEKMRQQGLQVVETPQALQDQFAAVSKDVRRQLAGSGPGKLYPPEWLAKVEALIAQKRGGK